MLRSSWHCRAWVAAASKPTNQPKIKQKQTRTNMHWPGWHPVENCLTRGGRKPINLYLPIGTQRYPRVGIFLRICRLVVAPQAWRWQLGRNIIFVRMWFNIGLKIASIISHAIKGDASIKLTLPGLGCYRQQAITPAQNQKKQKQSKQIKRKTCSANGEQTAVACVRKVVRFHEKTKQKRSGNRRL